MYPGRNCRLCFVGELAVQQAPLWAAFVGSCPGCIWFLPGRLFGSCPGCICWFVLESIGPQEPQRDPKRFEKRTRRPRVGRVRPENLDSEVWKKRGAFFQGSKKHKKVQTRADFWPACVKRGRKRDAEEPGGVTEGAQMRPQEPQRDPKRLQKGP